MAQSKLQIAQDKLKAVLADYQGDREAIGYAVYGTKGRVGWRPDGDPGLVTLDMSRCPADFLDHLLEASGALTERQFAIIYSYTSPDEGVGWSEPLSSPKEVQGFVSSLGMEQPNCEVMINGRWYPVTLRSTYSIVDGIGAVTQVTWQASVCHETIGGGLYATKQTFEDGERTATATELFARYNLRELDPVTTQQNDSALAWAQIVQDKTAEVMRCTGDVLIREASMWGQGFSTIKLGEEGVVSRVVVDAELEGPSSSDRYSRYGHSNSTRTDPLPFVRVFSLETKRWVFSDVRDLEDHEFDEGAIDRLVLPEDMLDVLKPLFDSEAKQLFGDLVVGKHGGMIILANGPTGTGKTLTAEVFAERTHRPLYVMEMFELGLDLKQVEKNLDQIFRRVTRWNAVLLMDECDIFLQERDANLEHNVMVGIFLRLMDYYKGLLFMTSNRGEAIDEAFKSRITLRLDYPVLDEHARTEVWASMLEVAGIEVTDGLDGVPEIELNGRQIRNLVRLVRVLHGTKVNNRQIKRVVQFACK